MCGRFLSLTKEDWKEILQGAYEESQLPVEHQDVYPSQSYLVKTNNGFKMMQWGIEPSWKKMRIINARVESVLEKPMFKHLYQNQRCIIYVKAFYEWDKQKHQYLLDKPNKKILALAGFYEQKESGDTFVIMTQDATSDFKMIHDRLPCMLDESMIDTYVKGESIPFTSFKNALHGIEWKSVHSTTA